MTTKKENIKYTIIVSPKIQSPLSFSYHSPPSPSLFLSLYFSFSHSPHRSRLEIDNERVLGEPKSNKDLLSVSREQNLIKLGISFTRTYPSHLRWVITTFGQEINLWHFSIMFFTYLCKYPIFDFYLFIVLFY